MPPETRFTFFTEGPPCCCIIKNISNVVLDEKKKYSKECQLMKHLLSLPIFTRNCLPMRECKCSIMVMVPGEIEVLPRCDFVVCAFFAINFTRNSHLFLSFFADHGKIIKAVNAESADSSKKVNSVVIEELDVLPTNEPIRNLEIIRTTQYGE